MNCPAKTSSGNVIPCSIALIHKDGHFLISQRLKTDTFGSYWEFPGGKKNRGETFEACAVRETLEETAVTIKVSYKLMEIKKEYFDKIIWLNFFICRYLSGEPTALECQQTMWCPVAELSQYHFPPANEIVIRKLVELYGK